MGFSEAALYRHFPSKHALLLAIVDRTQERFLGPIRDLAARPGPVEERLKEVLRHHVGLILDTDGMPFLFVAEATATGDEQLLARLRLVLSAYFGLLGDLLAELPPSPTRPAPRDLTLLLFGLAAATAVRLRVTGERPTGSEVEALVDFLVRQILAG
jgi:AcrR family transcriptional regulator